LAVGVVRARGVTVRVVAVAVKEALDGAVVVEGSNDLAVVVDTCGYGVRAKRGQGIVERGVRPHFTIFRAWVAQRLRFGAEGDAPFL
jgi:hypothetical protein